MQNLFCFRHWEKDYYSIFIAFASTILHDIKNTFTKLSLGLEENKVCAYHCKPVRVVWFANGFWSLFWKVHVGCTQTY